MSVAGCSMGMSNSMVFNNKLKVHSFVCQLDNNPLLFFIDTLCGWTLLTTVTRGLGNGTTVQVLVVST